MMIITNLCKILLLSFNLHAERVYITQMKEFSRKITYPDSPATHSSAEDYKKWQMEINPFIPHPYSIVKDSATDLQGKTIYDVSYNTEELGLRIVPEVKKNLLKHLIVAGDSNTFGVGTKDNETLPFYLSKKFTNFSVYNFGLAGSGPNSTLRFLEIFNIKDIAPLNYKNGTFILDYHYYYIARVIGSKSFLSWASTTPQYSLNNKGIPTYEGPFSDSMQMKFYNLLNKLPYSDQLFPDLPRISNDHIELTAKVIAEIKKRYLEQTSPQNHFFVLINPEEKSDEAKEWDLSVAKKLTENHVDVVIFNNDELLPLDHFTAEKHFTPNGHKNYAQMIFDKLNGKF